MTKLATKLQIVRCAIYTRKSTEEGLEQEFNSLDAQRESAKAYISSLQHEGWRCLPDRYDDGGFTGGNMERPALQRLMSDIENGRIDCVVVYKVDRLSRSLLDFARMMGVFDERKVAFVSVTQQFNTAHSMGRLVLNVLLSFAQFEREIISERTRDKIAAARKRGKWIGGMPILGYDVAHSKLVVNAAEAKRVESIFEMYLRLGSLMPVVQELSRRRWKTKSWITKRERNVGGRPFDRTNLYRLLTNIAYLGRVSHKGEAYVGEHDAIVPESTFNRVQELLRRNASGFGPSSKLPNTLLQGLIRCQACKCMMTPSFTTRGTRRYRYYVCTQAQKRGWAKCPSKSISAGAVEQFVIERIRVIAHDPELVRSTLQQVRSGDEHELGSLASERRKLERNLDRWQSDLRERLARGKRHADAAEMVSHLSQLQERISQGQRQLNRIVDQVKAIESAHIEEAQVLDALSQFETIWEAWSTSERSRVVRLLIERIDYDGSSGQISITFHSTGLQSIVNELAPAC